MAAFEIDERVDITDVVCPMTFVKAKVAMEEIEVGQVLAVTMNEGEPVQNVPRSFKEEGQQILKLIDNENGTYEQDFSDTEQKSQIFIKQKYYVNVPLDRIKNGSYNIALNIDDKIYTTEYFIKSNRLNCYYK